MLFYSAFALSGIRINLTTWSGSDELDCFISEIAH